MNRCALASFLAVLLLGGVSAKAADVAGSQDYPHIKRSTGSEIVAYKTAPFDEYTLSLSDQPGFFNKNNKNNKVQVIEGAVTRIVYRVPVGQTSEEIFHSYQQVLAQENFQTLFASSASFNDVSHFWGDMCRQGTGDNCADAADSSRNGLYMAAKRVGSNGKDIFVGVLVSEKEGNCNWSKAWRNPGVSGKDLEKFAKGEVIVLLDIIEPRQLDYRMVSMGGH